MSFRNDKDKSKAKLTAREQRIFHHIAGQRKAEEQDNIIEQFEGPKSKSTQTKKNATLVNSPNVKVSKWVQERAEIDKQAKNRLKKFKAWKKNKMEQTKNKRNKIFGELWYTLGANRKLVNSKEWTNYSKNSCKTEKYNGAQKPDTNPVWRFEVGREHPDRYIYCHTCEETIKSTDNAMLMTAGVCFHHSCIEKVM